MKAAVRVAVLSVPLLLWNAGPSALAQAPKESKAQRLEQLHLVLTHSNETIDTLECLKSGPAGEHAQELEAAKKARDAVQRLINQIEGANDSAGIEAAHKRDARNEKNPAPEYYPAIHQVNEDLELNYNILDKDPGHKNKNPHVLEALKSLDEAHGMIAREVADYERAHPAARVAAPTPAAPMPPAAAPPAIVPTAPDMRIPELNDAISHLDHSIDDIGAEATSDPLRQQALDAVTKARDSVRQLVDELVKTDASKDMAADHARDAAKRSGKTPDYYSSLIQVQEYLHNDHIVIGRQAADPNHLQAATLQLMDQANALVQQQIDAYRKAHPTAAH